MESVAMFAQLFEINTRLDELVCVFRRDRCEDAISLREIVSRG